MPTVTVVITSGLGNRFFKVAAMLGYAEQHGHVPVLVRSLIKDEPSHPGPYGISDFFPDLPLLDADPSIIELKESEVDNLTYKALPRVSDSVRLRGFYQSPQYFPTSPIPCPRLLSGGTRRPNAYFFHVRRGDYLSHWCVHHNVPLGRYWERCLALISIEENTRFLVCSDDIAWCKATLPSQLSRFVKPHQWEFLAPETSDADTLAEMIGCALGGICANSTFSWWAAYWIQNADKRVFMPGTWGFPPMPVARDIWPPWATKVPT